VNVFGPTSIQDTELIAQNLPSYNISTDCIENTVSSSSFIVACISIAAGTCLPSCTLAMALVYLLSRGHCIVTAVHVIVLSFVYSKVKYVRDLI
jgi:hypothetical protein